MPSPKPTPIRLKLLRGTLENGRSEEVLSPRSRLAPHVLNKLRYRCGPGESRSAVILRLAKLYGSVGCGNTVRISPVTAPCSSNASATLSM